MSTTTTTQATGTLPLRAESTGVFPSADEVPRGTVETQLTFFKAGETAMPGEPWFHWVETQPEGERQRNYETEPQPSRIHDLRGREADVNIDEWGFQLLSGVPTKTELADFSDDDKIKSVYYPEVEALLRERVPGAPQRIFIFDHTVRRSHPGANRSPVNRAHVDQTTRSAIERAHLHMGAEADELLKGRYRLINVWRPLNPGPVVASPLAVADSRSVADEDIVPIQHRYPHRNGETSGLKHTESAKWYYWSGMTNDERILLQCFDSELHARTPHTAFKDPRTQEGWPGRESIEIRALVFG